MVAQEYKVPVATEFLEGLVGLNYVFWRNSLVMMSNHPVQYYLKVKLNLKSIV